ncbi:Repetitive proline-rich cell wall protein 1 [Dictyocoela muelleri]|nr:Repetitive proline-rich cell wall protein 1 [Dictyocoela muelleri]
MWISFQYKGNLVFEQEINKETVLDLKKNILLIIKNEGLNYRVRCDDKLQVEGRDFIVDEIIKNKDKTKSLHDYKDYKEEDYKDEDYKEEVSKDEVSKDEVSKEEVSKDEVYKEEVYKDAVSKEEVSKEEVSKEEVSKDEVSKDEDYKVIKYEYVNDEFKNADEFYKNEFLGESLKTNKFMNSEMLKDKNFIQDIPGNRIEFYENRVKKYFRSDLQLSDILISHDGKLLCDNFPLYVLNKKSIILEIDVKEGDDVEMCNTERCVRVRNLINNKIIMVEPSQLLVREDGVYLVLSKSPKKNFINQVKDKISQIQNNVRNSFNNILNGNTDDFLGDFVLKLSLMTAFAIMGNFLPAIILLIVTLFGVMSSIKIDLTMSCSVARKIYLMALCFFMSIFVDGVEWMIEE